MAVLNKAVLVANVAELVDALDLGSSGATRESSSLSFRNGYRQHHGYRFKILDKFWFTTEFINIMTPVKKGLPYGSLYFL
jgi:hypothetical protein